MRFEFAIQGGGYEQGEGIPPNEHYPEWFVTDDGWIYPISVVKAFKLMDE